MSIEELIDVVHEVEGSLTDSQLAELEHRVEYYRQHPEELIDGEAALKQLLSEFRR